jgi:hypothetical protein
MKRLMTKIIHIIMPIKTFIAKLWEKIVSKKTAIIGVIAFLVLLITLLQGIDWIKNKFTEGEIVFKTTNIFPDVNNDNYNFCILPGAQVVPIVNPTLEEEQPKEASGPRYNIIFTVTNKANQELLIDDIKASLVEFHRLPEKCIVTNGPHAVLRPIDLYLNLDPNQNSYEMLKERYISIEGGKTEHVFTVWVAGKEPGIYKFKISIIGREGGNNRKVIESDIIYEFAVPEYSKSPQCFFTYGDRTKDDPNFQELFQIIDKPMNEFADITSGWGKFKILDELHKAPLNLLNFIRNNIGGNDKSEQIDTNYFNNKASKIALNGDDLNIIWSSMKNSDGTPIMLSFIDDDLPYWLVRNNEQVGETKAISKKTTRLTCKQNLIKDIYNTVAVYPTIDLAHQAFLNTITNETDAKYYQSSTGDESYQMVCSDNSVGTLVFREGNIVIAIIDVSGLVFLEKYAKYIETKIDK